MTHSNSSIPALGQVPREVTFFAYNGIDRVTLPLSKIRCIQARENYMEFAWEHKGTIQFTLLRNTLYIIEEQLPPYFQRIHRSIIINLEHVSILRRRRFGKGFELILENYPYTLPVSKTYLSTIAKQVSIPENLRVA